MDDAEHVHADQLLFDTAAVVLANRSASASDIELAHYYLQARALPGHTFRGIANMPEMPGH
jgi:hypothetical protein